MSGYRFCTFREREYNLGMKKYTSILLGLGMLATVGAPLAHAEEAVMTAGADATVQVQTGVRPGVKPAVKERVEAAKAKVEAAKEKMEVKAEVRAEKAEARKEVTAEMKAKLKARADAIKKEKKAKLDEAKRGRVETAARVSLKVLTDALARVQDLAVRAQNLATKLEARGVVTTDAMTKLTEAKALWDAAKLKVDGLEADLSASLASETPMATFETFRTHAGEARDGIRAAHGKVVEAIVWLKAAIPAPAAAASVEASAEVNAEANTNAGGTE